MKKILSSAALTLALLVPAASFAATYQYVSNDGTLKSITADSSAQALAIPSDIAPHSGVILVPNAQTTVTVMPVSGNTTTATVTMGSSTTMTSSSSMVSSSTSGMSSSTNTTAQNTAADMLKTSLRNLLSAHVTSSIDVLRDISAGSSTGVALQAQDDNAVALGAAIGSVYGTDAGNSFLKMFRDHIVASNAYTQAVKNGRMTDQTTAMKKLDNQLIMISNFLSGANPNIDNATLLAALRQHEDLINQSSTAFNQGNMTKSDDLRAQAVMQIQGGADYLSGAIIKQNSYKYGY